MRMKDFKKLALEEKVERWEHAIRVLQNLTPHERRKHWSMGWWGTRTACGTVACAAGHCALDPWFRRRGLSMQFKYRRSLKNWEEVFDPNRVPRFFGEEGSRAIFYNGHHRPVSRVIKEMRCYIRHLKRTEGRYSETNWYFKIPSQGPLSTRATSYV